MAGKREERKKARFHWLVTSWLIVAAVIIVGVGGIILFMNNLYHKEMRKESERTASANVRIEQGCKMGICI